MACASSFYTSAMDSAPPEISNEEESFVVLENPEESLSVSLSLEVTPPLRVNKVRDLQNLIKMEIEQIESEPVLEVPTVESSASIASTISKSPISPDTSYEEIQKTVEELIRENKTLQNIIVQNNLRMKTHYDRFVAYRDEVDSVMKKNKEKFSEAKNIIDKLKEENGKLTGEVDVYVNIKKLQEEEIINLKEKLKNDVLSYVDVKPEDDGLKEKVAELQMELQVANLKITDISTENDKLRKMNMQLNEKVETLEKATEKTQANNDEVANLQNELSLAEQKIQDLTQRLKQGSDFEDQLQTKLQENNLLQFEIKALKQRTTQLEQEKEALKSQTIFSETFKILEYENELKQKDDDIKTIQQSLAEKSSLLDTNDKKYKKLAEAYSNLEDNLTGSRQQLYITQQTITALEAEQEKKAEEIESLRKLLQKTENDEIYALKAQLDVFKGDYEAEKESKNALKREKDQIADDLKNIQNRNKQLQNEIETLRARCQPKVEGYICPKCSFGFNSYQSLENHVHRCLDLE